jgi:hypothetical protein
MNEKPKSKWYWRVLRWGLIGLAILATLVAMLVTEENWRGKHDWEAYKRQAEARGEHFDWSSFLPSNVPDDENFAKAPIFSSLTTMVWDKQAQDWKPSDTNAADRIKMSIYRADGSTPEGHGGSWEQARLTRLENWQDYYRSSTNDGVSEFPIAPQAQSPAVDVLLALSKYDSAIEELRIATQRPYFRRDSYAYNDRDFALTMTWLARFKGIAQVLQLRAIAELNNHQEAKALDDVQLLLRLDDELRQEPLLIGHLVSIAITAITLQPIYEGLAQHRWNDEQLAALQRSLAAKDFLADYQYAMRGERIFAVDMLESERIAGEYKTYTDSEELTVNMHWMPNAFFYQNELACARLNEEFLQPLADVTNRLVSPSALRESVAAAQEQAKHYSPYKILAVMSLPAVIKSVEKFAAIQVDVDLARVACALERYRLSKGKYPATLDALAPQFIETAPHDIINGQPLHYRLREDGPPSQGSGATSPPTRSSGAASNFVLYSVGWNETDDGGTVALTKSGTVDREKGDWVWQYPTK